jgi:hypothetical protein
MAKKKNIRALNLLDAQAILFEHSKAAFTKDAFAERYAAWVDYRERWRQRDSSIQPIDPATVPESLTDALDAGMVAPLMPPAKWIERNEPRQKTAIDHAIDRIKKLPAEELADQKIKCAYYSARIAAARAIAQANLADEATVETRLGNTPQETAVRLKHYAQKARKLAKALRAFQNDSASGGASAILIDAATHKGHRRRHPQAEAAIRLAIDALKTTVEKAADHLAASAQCAADLASESSPVGARLDEWKITFVYELGLFYRALTGRTPTPSATTFQRLVSGAYETLGGTKTEDWTRSIQAARHRIDQLKAAGGKAANE